jgi:hypothetical protein
MYGKKSFKSITKFQKEALARINVVDGEIK